MKDVLRNISDANHEVSKTFPLNLKAPVRGICRLSAHLHLFHHQCLILATRPLLFSFWQKRLEASGPLHVSPSHGARYLLQACIKSAQQSLHIVSTLKDQCLLESFTPFDRDATFSSAVVLSLASTVDPTLFRSQTSCMTTVDAVMGELAWKGSLIADFHRHEIEQLNANLEKMGATNAAEAANQGSRDSGLQSGYAVPDHQHHHDHHNDQHVDNRFFLGELNSEDGLGGDQLLAMADCLNMEQFEWFAEDSGSLLDGDFSIGM